MSYGSEEGQVRKGIDASGDEEVEPDVDAPATKLRDELSAQGFPEGGNWYTLEYLYAFELVYTLGMATVKYSM